MGRILGIDYGSKRIGLAITDELRIIATPLTIISNSPTLWHELQEIISSYNIDSIVIGVPFHDKENSFQPHVLGFIRKINRLFPFPIYLQDESLTSKEAQNFLIKTGKKGKKLKENLDKYAAQNILYTFLNNLARNQIVLFEEKKSQGK